MLSRLLPVAALLGGALLSTTAAVQAADVVEEPILIESAPAPVAEPVSTSGWYLRGDVGYARSESSHGRYKMLTKDVGGHNVVTEHRYEEVKSSDGWAVGGGVGYRFNEFLRTDLTADYYGGLGMRGRTPCAFQPAGTCYYDDKADVDLWTVMANVYADVYRYDFVTAYVGGGLGAAYVNYGKMRNKFDCPPGASGLKACGETYEHEGESSWRFAYSLAAGLTFDLSNCLKLDTGYRYTRVEDGDAFGWDKIDRGHGMSGVQGRDDGFNLHTVRAGLRYEFGGFGKGPGSGACGAPAPVQEVVYQEPVYK